MNPPLAACDINPGNEVNGVTYFDRTSGTADPTTIQNQLKAYTTNVASLYCEEQKVKEHWSIVQEIETNLGTAAHIVAKGGLALHFAINEMFKTLLPRVQGDNNNKLLAARDYILKTYAATSDLDTGISMEDPDDLSDVVDVVKEAINNMRNNWGNKDAVLQEIVDKCNEDQYKQKVMSDLGAAFNITNITFVVSHRPDQRVDMITNDPTNPTCKTQDCISVESTSANQPIFISDNESLIFDKGPNIADFYLVRAKWSISAVCEYSDGTQCNSSCPAELIDVAIPREDDSRRALSAELGTDFLQTRVDVNGIEIPMVTMKYQLMDLLEMCYEAEGGGVDPKIVKRIHRYIILKFINFLRTYLKDEKEVKEKIVKDNDIPNYDHFKAVNITNVAKNWRKLISVGIDEHYDLHEWMENEIAPDLDVELMRHLINVRDIIITGNDNLKVLFNGHDFSGVGGGSTKTEWHTAAALALVTLAMSFLGSM